MEISAEDLQRYAEDYLLPFGVNLLTAVIILLLGRWVARMLTRAVGRVMTRASVDASLAKFLSDLLYALLLVLVVLATLDRLGIPTTSAIAIIGAAGLAVGLALQSSLSNFAAGVMIILFKPYRVGHVVVLAGHTGTVDAIKIFHTVVHTGDNRQIILPNGAILNGTIENLSALGRRRVDMVFGIGYDDDLKQARQVLEDIVSADPRVLQEPSPVIAVSELADSSVNFIVRPWVKTEDYWAVKFETTQKVKEQFDDRGISIPYPQRDVHLHPASGASQGPSASP